LILPISCRQFDDSERFFALHRLIARSGRYQCALSNVYDLLVERHNTLTSRAGGLPAGGRNGNYSAA
jgi:hypothetical protein